MDEAAAAEDVITVVVQINGKVRDRLTLPAGTAEEVVKTAALESDNIRKFLAGQTPKKVFVVGGKLVNIVI